MKRRDLLKSGVTALIASLAGKSVVGEAMPSSKDLPQLPKRKYAAGTDLSIIGFGGIVVCGLEQPEANRMVADSIDTGVNYFDVAPSYFDGEAEEKLGEALKPYRKDIFLACKTTERDGKGARRELEISLKRTGVDHFDLYQFHAVKDMEDVEKILGPEGAAETFIKAQKEGMIRFIGFSAHSEEAAVELLNRFPVDSVLFPVNYVNYARANFGPKVVEKAKQKGAARLALKMLAYTPLDKGKPNNYPKCWYRPIDDGILAEKALRFTLSQDITAAIPPGDEHLFTMAVTLARRFTIMNEKEQQALLASAENLNSLFPLG